ncbi:MAG: hypothetical protein DBW85_03635 [Synechococcus sp. MED-G71]|jgi:biopolymer transport protein ExbD|nr:MAG: hypothetical protein DBW85_03635 [Synechococcus sp. MED-G71]|tara:strand:- start:3224 stop:3634 length:411 start_codon:yes stop_codon:yes gene_type:complete
MADLGRSTELNANVGTLIPLIDVLLVVLSFLIWMAVTPAPAPPAPRPLPSALPLSAPKQMLAMARDGGWRLDGRSISQADLIAAITAQNALEQPPRLLLIPADGMALEQVSARFSAMQAIAGARLQLQLPSMEVQP